MAKTKWTETETELLKSVYALYDNKYLVNNYFPDKTVAMLNKKATQFKMKKNADRIKSRPNITREECIEKLKSLAETLGRTPIHSELVKSGLPSLPTYRLIFGNYTNACKESGLTPNFSKIGVGRKSVLKSKNGDDCYSIYEQIITDFFIDSHIIYKKEERYSNHIQDKQCKTKRTDWLLEDGTFVEYWGFPDDKRYCKQMNLKKKLCKKGNINLINIHIEDINNLTKIFKKYID